MPVLKCPNGMIYTLLETINKIIAPNLISAFTISESMQEIAKNNSFNDTLKKKLIDTLPAELVEGYHEKHLRYFNTFIVRSDISADFQKKIDEYAQPHKNNYSEIHHVIDGAVMLGFVIPEQQVILALLPGEQIYIPEGIEHWANLTADKRVTVISCKSKPLEKQVTQRTATKVSITF